MYLRRLPKKTLQFTTHSGIRTVFHLSLSKIFGTNEGCLRYQRFPHNVFRDKLVAGITSKLGVKYVEFLQLILGGRVCLQ